MAATMPEIPLPEKVELQLDAICNAKSQLPADADARKLLAEIGEEESLKILSIIYNTTTVKTLSGFIRYLVKKSRSTCSSPCSPLSALRFPLNHNPQENTSHENKRKRDSECSARQVYLFASPTSTEAKVDPPKSDSDVVVEELDKLEFRKAFLILSYMGRSKLEEVVSADRIRSYQRLAMREFETQIWNDFGRVNCGEKGGVKIMNWDTGENYYYHCHVDAKGQYCFKGPFLNKAATFLQKTAGDENVLIVKFVEQETDKTDSIKQSPVFNEAYEKGIFVGRRCYRFFGELY